MVVNPDRLSLAELSAIRALQRCVTPPMTGDPVRLRLGERGLMLVKSRESVAGAPDPQSPGLDGEGLRLPD
jgi:hypothetical protein